MLESKIKKLMEKAFDIHMVLSIEDNRPQTVSVD